MNYRDLSQNMRIYHRYLGFFLAGIMAMYAISGIILVYRNTDFLKKNKHYSVELDPNLSSKEVGQQLRIKNLVWNSTSGDVAKWDNGTYNLSTGQAEYSKKELPAALDKMTHFHKAKKGDPLYGFNLAFGFALLFFVVSSFFMFMPRSNAMKKGWYWALAGLVFALIILWYKS